MWNSVAYILYVYRLKTFFFNSKERFFILSLVIHSSFNRHLGCFHLLATVHYIAAVNSKYLFESLPSLLKNIYLEVELLELMVIYIHFWELFTICHTSYHSSCTILHSCQQSTRVQCLHVFTSIFFYILKKKALCTSFIRPISNMADYFSG